MPEPWPADPDKLEQVLNDPTASFQDFDVAYLPFVWETILETARAGHGEDGRGCVVVDLRKREAVSIYYLSEARAKQVNFAWPTAETTRLVRTYHPASEVICLTFHPNEQAGVYHLELPSWQPGD